jgi:hypothetical protein
MSRLVFVGLTGAQAIAVRAQADIQIDRDEDLLARTQDPEDQLLLKAQIDLLTVVRDKFDMATTLRDEFIPVPF